MIENPMAALNCTVTMIASVRFQDGIPIPARALRRQGPAGSWNGALRDQRRQKGLRLIKMLKNPLVPRLFKKAKVQGGAL